MCSKLKLPVSARARQLIHKMKGRRAAILTRRETESAVQPPQLRSTPSSTMHAEANGSTARPFRSVETPSPPMGFTAVNPRHSISEAAKPPPEDLFPGPGTGNVTYINGRSIKGASETERAEMMKKFMSSGEHEPSGHDPMRRSSMGSSSRTQMQVQTDPRPRSGSIDYRDRSSLVAIPSTPSQLMPQVKSPFLERDDGGPFKSEMVSRMESMHRGERVLPPCDRCRRLHMDCLKNLTACMGCTKKHAKCSWKDVRPDELHELAHGSDAEHEHVLRQDAHTERSSPPTSVADISRQIESNIRPQGASALPLAPPHAEKDIIGYAPPPPQTSYVREDAAGDTVMGGTIEPKKDSPPPRPDPPLATEALRPVSPPQEQPPMQPQPQTQPQTQPQPQPQSQPVQSKLASETPPPPPPAAAYQPPPQASAPPPAPQAQSKFDLKPPAFVSGMQEAAKQFSPPPPRYPTYSTYPPREQARQVDPDEDDEGDRLQQLARQVYRSASQSAKPQET